MSDGDRVLIIIPAYNEEKSLPGVLDELLSEVSLEDVIVVVDGSTDQTAAVARQAGAHVAELPFNLGIGGALRTGFRFAQRAGYTQAVQLDADGQHDPTHIKRLLDALDDGADMVVGSRFSTDESHYAVGRVRGRAMALLRLTIKLLSGHHFTDTSSGFRAFSRPVIDLFAQTYPVEYMDSVEALLLACYAGFRVAEVPTTMRHRVTGTPSTRRLRLAYHYLRLMIVLIATAPSLRRQPRRGRT
ncbi:MAG: glycosyltransferase family 2 protein [Actinomycetota bacterium]|nr:glycosyltransferase family 2 protein [Actinomycetota bacterium]